MARGPPPPHGKQIQVICKEPLSEDNQRQITDAHPGNGKEKDDAVRKTSPADAGKHCEDDPDDQFSEENRNHQHQRRQHPVPEFRADRLLRLKRIPEIQETDIREILRKRHDFTE